MNETHPVKWADPAQYWAQPVERNERGVIVPKVYLLSMNEDPLGDLASMNMMYSGEVVRSLREVTDQQRRYHWDQVMATHLKAPLEVIHFHFLIEGVDRSFTHQMVRQRTAAYAQESLRFAVKDEPEYVLPPSIADLPSDEPRRLAYLKALEETHDTYRRLVNDGIPSEDARSLLPHAIATRLHYTTNLRNLAEQAGNRLCTQAQFHWRFVFAGIVHAIRMYGYREDYSPEWQYELIANSLLFRPVCYQVGKCPWKGDIDRPCSIRDRVETYSANGIPSSDWDKPLSLGGGTGVGPIRPEEWLLNSEAAR